MVQEDLKEKGYSKEDEYFYKLNKELIERKRKEQKGFLGGLKQLFK